MIVTLATSQIWVKTHTHTHSLSLSQALCFRNLLESGGIWTIRVWGVPLNLGLGA